MVWYGMVWYGMGLETPKRLRYLRAYILVYVFRDTAQIATTHVAWWHGAQAHLNFNTRPRHNKNFKFVQETTYGQSKDPLIRGVNVIKSQAAADQRPQKRQQRANNL